MKTEKITFRRAQRIIVSIFPHFLIYTFPHSSYCLIIIRLTKDPSQGKCFGVGMCWDFVYHYQMGTNRWSSDYIFAQFQYAAAKP